MRYYILTTTKFAQECIENNIYGSTNSNWLSNIEVNDCIFISQFNYNSQTIYGPFKVLKTLFYDKNIIYPNQKYYYRIKLENTVPLKVIEETDLYLKGIKDKKVDFAFRAINLIQQNKHLHSICLNDTEGQFISDSLKNFGKKIKLETHKYSPDFEKLKVDLNFLSNKNKLSKKLFFSSESDLESFIILSLKDKNSPICNQLAKILNDFSDNDLPNAEIYNQFIFGNAYPADIVMINKNNINIFELKKDTLSQNALIMIKKEMRKYCYYSLFSHRIQDNDIKRVNFFLLVLKGDNQKFKNKLHEKFNETTKLINGFRENNLIILEYYIRKNQLFIEVIN